MGLDREWMRGAAPLAVMTLLADGEMYGYELVEALEARSGGLLEMGQSTVYPLLYTLEKRGHLAPHWRQAESGRRRKYYRLTAEGRAWMNEQQGQFERLVTALRRLGRSSSGAPEPAEAP